MTPPFVAVALLVFGGPLSLAVGLHLAQCLYESLSPLESRESGEEEATP